MEAKERRTDGVGERVQLILLNPRCERGYALWLFEAASSQAESSNLRRPLDTVLRASRFRAVWFRTRPQPSQVQS